MLGQCTVNVQLGEQTFPYLMWVAEIQEDCLLGFDFMKDTKAVLNVDQGNSDIHGWSTITPDM